MSPVSENICSLCGRIMADPCNRHHLLPVSKGGKNTPAILLHKICHDKIHAVFTELELKKHYNAIDKIQQHEEIVKFMKWVRNKEPQFYDESVKLKNKKFK